MAGGLGDRRIDIGKSVRMRGVVAEKHEAHHEVAQIGQQVPGGNRVDHPLQLGAAA